MAFVVNGLVVRENPVGEADRFVTLLTDRLGVIRASARGARKIQSRAGSSTRLLSYATFSLIRGREKYIIESAVPQRVFFAVGGDLDRLSLAQYLCELFDILSPRDEEAGEHLLLLLRALHLLEAGPPCDKIKATAELRLLCLSGYRPDLSRCPCGREGAYLHPPSGGLRCSACEHAGGAPLTPASLAAMRFIAETDGKHCFSFRLGEDGCRVLANAVEAFLLYQISRPPKTLAFYHHITQPGEPNR